MDIYIYLLDINFAKLVVSSLVYYLLIDLAVVVCIEIVVETEYGGMVL